MSIDQNLIQNENSVKPNRNMVREGYKHGYSLIDYIAKTCQETSDTPNFLYDLLNRMVDYHKMNPDSKSFWFGKKTPRDYSLEHKAVADLVYLTEIAWNVHVLDMEYSQGNAHAAMTLSKENRKTIESIHNQEISPKSYHPFLALIHPLTNKLERSRDNLSPWTSSLLNKLQELDYKK